MPRFRKRPPKFSPPRTLTFEWNNFRGGLNTLFKDTELDGNELAQTQNLMLVGKGIPTRRWGTSLYFLSSATGSVRGLSGFYQSDGTNQVLAITDEGYLTQKSNASYSTLTGVSWASGYNAEMSQISDKMYIVGGDREMARYSNPTLVGFPTIGQPSGVFATQISGASGTNTHSYRITHTTDVGETAAADAYQLASQPEDLSDGSVKVEWTNASTASGIRNSTNIYRGNPGDETFAGSVDGEATEWIDDGSAQLSLFGFAPTVDTSGGIAAEYIVRFKDRLVTAGIDGDPTLVKISGSEPLHERTDFGSNGGIVRIEPDSGDDITGLAVKGDKIIVFKERSIWEITLDQRAYKVINDVTLTALDPQIKLITNAVGCASHRTIKHVENDIFFLASGGRGVYVLGNEPGIIGDILRTNEISVKVRPFFENLSSSQEAITCAGYHKNKYMIGVPGKNQTMVFDRERTAWMGPWTFDARIFHVYYDSDNQDTLLKGGDSTPDVEDISSSYPGDRGSAFSTILRTKREDFGDWSTFKNVKNIFTLFKNVAGSANVQIRLEERTGNTVTPLSFTVTTGAGNSGWGADIFGTALWGNTNADGEARDLSEIVKQAFLQKAARNTQLIIKTNDLHDKYELMGVKGEAQTIGQYRPTSWKV